MKNGSRREFLSNVGKGMLVATVGPTLAADLGFANINRLAAPDRLLFGSLEPLVSMMQETAPDKLLPMLVAKLGSGTELRTLVAAGALANARTFGGHDYIGFHTFMALPPAYSIAQELPAERRSLPVLKVLYRNAARMQAFGGRSAEILHEMEHGDGHAPLPSDKPIQQASRNSDMAAGERALATLLRQPAGEAFNHLQYAVQDEMDVHRVVLSWRAWSALDITGQQHAATLLRQSVHYCVNVEKSIKNRSRGPNAIRVLLPKLLDQYKLLDRAAGNRRAEDGWIEKMSHLIADSAGDKAADAVAAALADGIHTEDIGQAISLAANELVLRDPGRPKEWSSDEKPAGSVHGDSVGVHASDAANAWRNIARVSNSRNTMASLIVGAYHTAGQFGRLNKVFYPLPEHMEKVAVKDQAGILRELDGAIREKDQFRAMALVVQYGRLSHAIRPMYDLLLKYSISEDGALHAEKYYQTVVEEYENTRPAFRWRQLVALSRVVASEYGRPAPGYAQACELLKV